MAAKIISASKLRNNLADALDSVKPGTPLIVKKRGQPRVAIVDLDEYEDMLAVINPDYIKSIAKARNSKKRYTMEEVFADVWDETE